MAADTESAELPKRSTRRRAVKHRIKRRYDRHMPDKKHHRVLIWMVFFTAATVIAVQLLYPVDRAVPLARLTGERVGWQTHERLAKAVDTRFRETTLRLVIDEETSVEVPLATAGAEPNTEPMVSELTSYPFWQRFIPFSIFLRNPSVETADVYYTQSVLRAMSEEQSKELSFAPVNARLAIEDGRLVATAEKAGREVAADEIYEVIAQAMPTLGAATELTVPAKPVEPAETSSSLKDVQSAAEAALGRKVVITAGEHTFTASEATIASWLQLATGADGKPTLKVADDKLNKYFDSIDAKAGTPAGQTHVSLSDGHETGRTTGRTGSAIRRTELKPLIANWLLKGEGQGELTASFYDIAPSVIYNRKYTSSEAGLQAYVIDASRRMDVRIAIQQVDGKRWSASARASESLPSASTYKLFVAKWLFDEMDKGNIHWNDTMLDTTVSGCFDRMIIASTNPCAESWLARAGRDNFNRYIYGLGFSRGTNFAHPTATHSTANDLQRMMLGINDGSLIRGAHRDRLLRSIANHPFRYGIPAGSGGQVYDKVGFLWDYVHDTAIVRHPKGTYVMTIMTKGQSYATIATLTREIERIMYP